jgi:DNA-binding NarL/FixJ family response regulator
MIEVFIVEDHAVVTEGIRVLLQQESDILVKGQAATGADCLRFFSSNRADVVLLDIGLPDGNGLDLCQQLKTKYPGLMLLALSTYSQGTYMNKFIENGGSGYLLKNASRTELVSAIRAVAKGKQYFSFEAGRIYKAAIDNKSRLPVLTRREQEVLKLVAEGLTNPEISQQLFISIDTVDTHRKNLYAKLNVKNTAQLIRYAIEQGILL